MSEKDKHVMTLEQLQHEHPLELVDLLPNYPQYDEYKDDDDDDDDEDDDHTKWDFCSPCNLCGQEVNLYQRYYYRCTHDSCDYFLHKWCRELPTTTISLRSHRCVETLSLCNILHEWRCEICKSRLEPNESVYRCPNNRCYFHADVECVIASIENQIIYHPSHPHSLVRATHEPIVYHCDACGEKHMGHLYHCTTCFSFSVQSDCLFLSKKKLTAQHTHPLILSYSFPWEHQKAEFYPTCRICRGSFHNETLWIYKCYNCRYYAHLDCIKENDFISETGKDYEESDHPNILNLPFRDQTNSIQKHLFSKLETTSTFKITNELFHINCHQHPLRLVHTQPSSSDDTICCHNPMKKIELLCDGCLRPIMSLPVFQCTDDQGCSFVLHQWCARLPSELQNHPAHPQHTLILIPKVPGEPFGVFECHVCRLPCNGFAYGCEICEYYIDVTCGFMPQEITHEAHPNHLFLRVDHHTSERRRCLACLQSCHSRSFSYKCRTCEDVYLHPDCALLLPNIIMHKYDKHPMKLSYMPVENHKSEYFCEICEEKLNPNTWFYHCYDECAQSVHSECAPLILDNERETASAGHPRGVYEYVNIKFGSVHNNANHSHSLLFSQGIKGDPLCVCGHTVPCSCETCGHYVWSSMVFRCLQCKFVIHYKCWYRLNN